MEYRGIKIHESVKLYKKNGEFYKTLKSALDRFYEELKKTNYHLVSEYEKTMVKVDFICDKGHPFSMTPNSFVTAGQRCPECFGNTPEKAKRELLKLVEAYGHELKNDYINSKHKILIDFKCGHEPRLLWPGDYRNGTGCDKCSNSSFEQAKENFYLAIKKAGYKALGEYQGGLKRVELLCDKGHICRLQPTAFVHRGDRCKKCSYKKVHEKRSKRAEKGFIEMLNKNGHILESPYDHARKPVLVDFGCKHKSQPIRPNDYKNGRRCPICKLSRGAIAIYEWLIDFGLDVKAEYKLPKRNWQYDFYIPTHNLIVEVHGKQHSQETFYNSVNTNKRARRTLKEEQENDRKKRKYAESLGYQYMEVDYREGNPKLTLERFLKEFQRKGSTQIKPDDEQLSLF